MPFSREWNPSRPLGSVDAQLIDEEIRILRQDIGERMDALTGGQWTGETIEEGLAVTKIVPWYSGHVEVMLDPAGSDNWVAGHADESTAGYLSFKDTHGMAKVLIPLNLPVGGTLKRIDLDVWYQHLGQVMTASLVSSHWDGSVAGLDEDFPTLAAVVDAPQRWTLDNIDHVVLADYSYAVLINIEQTFVYTEPEGPSFPRYQLSISNLQCRYDAPGLS